jgi:3-oxosteroid 1-dehydrogenase
VTPAPSASSSADASNPGTWDATYDLVCVGSGAASMAAAVRCKDLGHTPLIVEATDQYGGSTAISGGVVWIPDNPQMPSRGISDSRQDSIDYLTHLTKGMVAPERIAAYVDHSRRMHDYMAEKTHLILDSLEAYSDYYREAPGGKPGGRSMEPVPFDATKLGEHFYALRKPHAQSQILGKFGITAREAHGYLVPTWAARFKLVGRMVQYMLRWFKRRRFHRDTKLHAGNALIGRLRKSLLDRNVDLWLRSPATGLVVEDGQVTGVVVEHEGRTMRIRAKQGVLLGAGGFERNGELKARYQRQPTSPDWNAGNPRNLGDGIVMGIDAGGAVDLMERAWWTPVTLIPRAQYAWVLVVEKSMPGSFMVNAEGKRFCNEAAPYLDVGEAMYAGNAVPDAFLVFDAEFRARYPVGPVAPGYAQPDSRLPRRLRDGFLIKADTIEALAEKCSIDPTALRQTTDHFNEMARAGKDLDFQRGDFHYDRYYADHTVSPNPTMRPLVKGPFYAIRVYPGDLGTKGGLVTDAAARVLDASGTPIPGLFAAGNTSASVMGPTYPGAGGTIGPALTFGFLAAETAAGIDSNSLLSEREA